MPLLIILLSLEVLTFLVIREHFGKRRKAGYIIALIINISLSLALWYLFIRNRMYKGDFDTAENISMKMSFTGMICSVAIPRFFLSLFHYAGKMKNLRKGTYSKGLTTTGIIISLLIFSIVTFGTFYGRFNFKTENITIKLKGLKPELNGFRIVQISDLHLAGFYGHYDKLDKAVKIINKLKPDILINTGDFISYGWREFGRCDTILEKAGSRYGKYAIIGNHDFGTYMPGSTLAEKADILSNVSEKISASGYTLLNNSNNVLRIGNSKIELIGVVTGGKHRHLIHSDIKNAMAGADSADLRILLCHDPNQWAEEVAGKLDIGLTLSGHTHGMQMGILTKWFRWSPAKRFYPHWNGLYSQGDQYHYVNRGLGTLAIPFRLWMPPEITVITLKPGTAE
jgi:uncharacterized protein